MMTLPELELFFGYMSMINIGLLLFSFLVITLSRSWVHKLHGKIFSIPEESVEKSLYLLIAGYKIIILVFNVVPWLVLKILF